MISRSRNGYLFSLLTIMAACFLAVAFILAFASIADAHNPQSSLPALDSFPDDESGVLDSTRQVTPTLPPIGPTTPPPIPIPPSPLCLLGPLCPALGGTKPPRIGPKVPGGTDDRFALTAALILAGYELPSEYSNQIKWTQPDYFSGLWRDDTIDIPNSFFLEIGLK